VKVKLRLKVRPVLKALPIWLLDSAMMAIPPMLVNNSLPWSNSYAPGHVAAFFASYAGMVLAWLLILSFSGYSRWRMYGSWRAGLRPCLCDKPGYCFRHHSSAQEPNRPGVVAARLAEREGA
jgi:hypothetical protein